MPKISRWFGRAGLVYLVLGLTAGVLHAVGLRYGVPNFAGTLAPLAFHLLVVGWVTQLIVAVMIWMFPIHSKDAPRGNERLWWATLALLNSGLILRAIAEPLNAMQSTETIGLLLVASGALQWAAAVAIVINSWPRIKAR